MSSHGWWVVIDVTHDLLSELWVGPYRSELAATVASVEALLVEDLVSNTRIPYVIDDITVRGSRGMPTARPDAKIHLINLDDPHHDPTGEMRFRVR